MFLDDIEEFIRRIGNPASTATNTFFLQIKYNFHCNLSGLLAINAPKIYRSRY